MGNKFTLGSTACVTLIFALWSSTFKVCTFRLFFQNMNLWDHIGQERGKGKKKERKKLQIAGFFIKIEKCKDGYLNMGPKKKG